MAKKLEYKVITVSENGNGPIGGKEQFERDVTVALNDGWELAGGVCMTMPNALGIKYYSQAVVK